jgi:ribosomal protein S18 acetylase RimI-like enzyme
VLGYQLSTSHSRDGHLARLAVLPDFQGRGLGGMLIGEMVRFFEGRGVTTLTVITQEDNLASQHLYRRLGFDYTGHRVPVWSINL